MLICGIITETKLLRNRVTPVNMSTIDRIKKNRIVKMVYEAPYKTFKFCKNKVKYRVRRGSLTAQDIAGLKACKDIHKGERCFVVAMGPSLNEEDVMAIKDEYKFTVNSGYRVLKQFGLYPDYYVTMDDDALTAEQTKEAVFEDNGIKKVFLSAGRDYDSDKVLFLPVDSSYIYRLDSILNAIMPKLFPFGKFSNDISRVIYSGKTALCICLQLAAYMGFSEIYLIGADMDYTAPKPYTELCDEGTDSLKGRDPYDMSATMRLQMGAVAYDAAKKGAHIYNATRGGALECFERRRLEDVLLR